MRFTARVALSMIWRRSRPETVEIDDAVVRAAVTIGIEVLACAP
jgi:Arc/MetJ family transcription regulator